MNSILQIISNSQANTDNLNQTLYSPILLPNVQDKSVFLDFNGGLVSSDAGILLLKEIEEQIGLIKSIEKVIPESRDTRYVRHAIRDLLMQRVAQIACGYEDAYDCNDLRNDPIFKMLADRYPETGEALASQPTMSRFENSISRPTLYRIARVFADVFVASYEQEPEIIVLDFDDTDDIVHGTQQLSLFNNYFKEYCFMPLHVYEGLSGKLVTTILKPGKRSTGKQMLSIVKRIVAHLRTKWPNTILVFRGDSHFTYPEVMEWIDAQENVMFVTGLSSNSRLQKEVKSLEERAIRAYEECSRKIKITLFHSFHYQADSWSKPRRVIAKVEVSEKGKNVRFVVTDMENAKATVLYKHIYCARGEDELYIKDHKLYLKSDRTSCHRFEANQFRVFLHSAAYVLIHALKTNILRCTQLANATMDTIRLRLFKIGARVREFKTRIKIELPSFYPLKDILKQSFQIFNALRRI
ncbi:MAG: IS1380 family transposase [Nitrospirota bacterium]